MVDDVTERILREYAAALKECQTCDLEPVAYAFHIAAFDLIILSEFRVKIRADKFFLSLNIKPVVQYFIRVHSCLFRAGALCVFLSGLLLGAVCQITVYADAFSFFMKIIP